MSDSAEDPKELYRVAVAGNFEWTAKTQVLVNGIEPPPATSLSIVRFEGDRTVDLLFSTETAKR